MPDLKPFDILVLGPMALKHRGMVASEPRTRDLKRLVESIVADIRSERSADGLSSSSSSCGSCSEAVSVPVGPSLLKLQCAGYLLAS